MGNSYNNFIGWFTWYDIFSKTEILRGNRKGHALIILAIKSYMHRKIHDYYFSTNNKLYIMCELSHFCGVWLRLYGLYVACQAPLSMDFSRQEYWSGLWGPPPGRIFLTQASNPSFLHCRQILHCWAPGEAHFTLHIWANFKRVGSGTKFLMQNVEKRKNYEYFTYTWYKYSIQSRTSMSKS